MSADSRSGPEQELGRLRIRGSDAEETDLVLTSQRIYQNANRGIFGTASVSIPLAAIDSIRWGWRRYGLLLAIGIIATILALSVWGASDAGALGALLLLAGLVAFLLFWIVKPSGIEVRSVRETISGVPKSHADGEWFIERLLQAVAAARPQPVAEALPTTFDLQRPA